MVTGEEGRRSDEDPGKQLITCGACATEGGSRQAPPGEQRPNCPKRPGGLQVQRDKLPSPAPRQGLVTKHSSRGQTHYLLPASCHHAGPDIQLGVNQSGGHWGPPPSPPPQMHRERPSHPTLGLG